MMTRGPFPLLSVLLLLVLGPALPASAEEPPPAAVRIATEGAYPPFNFVDDKGEPQGFEIDLARAFCAHMGTTCSFVIDDWDSLIPDLEAGKFDAIVASLGITDEHRERIAFTRPYYRTPAVFMARKDNDLTGITPEAMAGRKLGAMTGTGHAAYLQDLYSARSEVSLYANLDEASLDLALGRIDAVLGDKIALQEWLKRGQEATCCAFYADAPREPDYFGEGYGIGLRKQDDALRARFDAAIAATMADGTYDTIRAKYFPFDVR